MSDNYDIFEDHYDKLYNKMLTLRTRDMLAILTDQCKFSFNTFGPGGRTAGVIDHIEQELIEIKENPTDLVEWIDLAILAFDGAWRSGHTPLEIVTAYKAKLEKNKKRKWPDWRTAEPGKAINHIKE